MNNPAGDMVLAAPCGLYCGACAKYLHKKCNGCRSDKHLNNHKNCEIHHCCINHMNHAWCFECNDFPCNQLKKFTQTRNWISHERCIDNLYRMRQTGVEKWLSEQAGVEES